MSAPTASHSAPPTPKSYALVLGDQPLISRGIAEFLCTHSLLLGAYCFDEAQRCDDFLKQQAQGPALMVIDEKWSNHTGLQQLARLKARYPQSRYLLVCDETMLRTIGHAQLSGAHGLIVRSTKLEQFSQAISAVLTGREYWPQGTAAVKKTARKKNAAPEPHNSVELSQRQMDVLELVLMGLANKRIAQTLGITENTVKEYVGIVLRKYGVASRSSLMALLASDK